MTTIKRKGMPNRQTKGALGTIYIDTETGDKYKCTQAYSCSTVAGVQYEYEWKLVYKKPNQNNNFKKVEPVVESVTEDVKDTPVAPAYNNNKTNYAKHYNNNNKKH